MIFISIDLFFLLNKQATRLYSDENDIIITAGYNYIWYLYQYRIGNGL